MNGILAFFATLGLMVGGEAFLLAGHYLGFILALVSGYSLGMLLR